MGLYLPGYSSYKKGVNLMSDKNILTNKCVDVSSYQGNINWEQVKSAGVHQAILKIIRKDLNPDTKFEQNWKGCQDAGVTVSLRCFNCKSHNRRQKSAFCFKWKKMHGMA